MTKVDNHNLQEFDVIIERLKKFRSYLEEHQGEEMKGSKIEDRCNQDMWLMTRWMWKYVRDVKWENILDMKNLSDALND
ncbi:MAG: hypothetical protein M3P08_11060 [Thermoproteota archaeon]|nr:hypothetical protein [Thermoproteota archaeon]